MKRFDPEPDDCDDDDLCDEIDNGFDDDEVAVMKSFRPQKATWREIEKKRELIALSRMIGESIDDHIFN